MTEKRERRFLLHTLRGQLAFFLFGLVFLSIFSIFLINGFFLQDYYISRKAKSLIEVKSYLDEMDVQELMQMDREEKKELIPDEVRNKSNRNNFSWVIITPDNLVVAQAGDNDGLMQSRLFGYIYGLDTMEDQKGNKILEKTDDYIVELTKDRFMNREYVEIWGILKNNSYFIVRTPLESIRESANISNRFYFLVGSAIALISAFLSWLVTKKITRPISELTSLSEKMADLQFDQSYQGNVGNEIDVLGRNFNHMSEELEKTIRELKEANLQLERDIEQKIKEEELRKEFLDSVSHELKTPIALIQGYAEGLLEDITDDPVSRQFYCEVIVDEAAKMNTLVKSLLNLNQLESGRDNFHMEIFNLTDLIKGVISSMDILLEQSEAKLSFTTEEPVYVYADEFHTEEVVTNYLSNALHHLDGDHKIRISIESQDEERIRVRVYNDGNPIPEKDIPNLWDKFYKVDKARTREYGGSGIGLSIVKAILDTMQQEYGVSNTEEGVEFFFTLKKADITE